MAHIRDVQKLQPDIENDPVIKYQMPTLSCLLMCDFGYILVPVVAAAHTVNNFDLGNNQRFKDKCHDSANISPCSASDGKKF